jgi:glucokinase
VPRANDELTQPTTPSDPEGALALAVDVGGTKVEAALVDSAGRLVPGTRHRSPTGASSTEGQLADAVGRVVEQTIATLPPGSQLVGAGVGSAGPSTP